MKVNSLITHKGKIIVATDDGVFVLDEEANEFKPVRFVTQNELNQRDADIMIGMIKNHGDITMVKP